MKLTSKEKVLLSNLYAMNKFDQQKIVDELINKGYAPLMAQQMAERAASFYHKRSQMTSTKGLETWLKVLAFGGTAVSIIGYALFRSGFIFTGRTDLLEVAIWIAALLAMLFIVHHFLNKD